MIEPLTAKKEMSSVRGENSTEQLVDHLFRARAGQMVAALT